MFANILDNLIDLASQSILCSKHAAALIDKKSVLSKGINYHHYCGRLLHSVNTNIISSKDYKEFVRNNVYLSIHAEEEAILKYFKNRPKGKKKLHMIVIRIDAYGDLTESKPCLNCIEIMKKNGVKKVSYSTKEGNIITVNIEEIDGRLSKGQLAIKRLLK